MKDLGFIKKTGLYFIGNLSTKIITAIIIPIYAFYITAEDLGFYDYAITLSNMIMPIVFFAIWESILRYILTTENKKIKQKIIGTSLIFINIISLASFIVALLIPKLFNISFKNVMYIFLIFIVYSYTLMYQYYSRSMKENSVYVLSGIVSSVIKFLGIIILVCFLKLGLEGLLFSDVLGQLIAILLIENKLKLSKYFNSKYFSIKILRRLLRYSIPLVANLSFLWAINGFGRLLITNKLGDYSNGLYSFGLKFSTIISVFGSVISMALIEEAILKIGEADNKEYFSNILEKISRLFLSIIIVILPCIIIFYSFIKETDYYSIVNLTSIFLLYGIFSTMGTNVGSIFQAMNQTKKIFKTTCIGAIVTVFLSIILINDIGILGVAIGQLMGALVVLILRHIYARKLIDLSLSFRKISILFVTFILFSILSINMNIYVSVLMLLTGSVIVFFVNIKELFYIKTRIINQIKLKRKL